MNACWASAISGSIALILLIASASSCSFVTLHTTTATTAAAAALNDTSEQVAGSANQTMTSSSTNFGVYCHGDDFYDDDLQDDGMWIMSNVFLSLALVLGCISTALAWVVLCCCINTTFTKQRVAVLWQTVSVTAAVCAILCVPVFLLFATEPCTDATANADTDAVAPQQQSCSFSSGAYLLLFSLIFWIGLAVLTQFVDPPDHNISSSGDGEDRAILADPNFVSSESVWQQMLCNANRLRCCNDESRHDQSSSEEEGIGMLSRFRKRWLFRATGDNTKKGELPALKVDRTMEEDEEDGIMAAARQQQQQQYDAIEVTAEQATILMETIEEDSAGDDDAGEEKEEEEEEDYENTPVTRNFDGDAAAPTSARNMSPVPWDSSYSIVSLSNDTPLYSSSLLPDGAYDTSVEDDSRTLLSMRHDDDDADGAYDTFVEDETRALISMRHDDDDDDNNNNNNNEMMETPPAAHHELDASLEAESLSIAMGLGNEKVGDASLYHPTVTSFASDDYQAEAVNGESDEEDRDEEIDDEDDLGSLEPTVVEVTGEESILDQTLDDIEDAKGDVSKEPSSSAISTKAIVQKVMQTPMDLGLAVISRAKSRRRRTLKGYKLMDDSNISSSYPMSPPLEILTLNISRDSDFDLNPVAPSTQKEQDLLDKWKAMHKDSPPVAQTFSDEPEPDLDSSDDDSSGGRYFGSQEYVQHPDDEGGPVKLTIDGISPIKSTDGSMKRRRRGRKSRRVQSARSVASATSLLSAPIAEETAEDLEPSDGSEVDSFEKSLPNNHTLIPAPLTRSRSAPPLAGFGKRHVDSGDVYEDIHMTGINSYHTAHIFRRTGEASKSSTEKSSVGSGSGQGSSGKGMRGWKRRVPPSSSSVPDNTTKARVAVKKQPMFRKERALRAGIHHVPNYVSDPSSSEDSRSASSAPSLRSRQARQARLRRLQGHSSTQTPPRSGATVKSTGTPGSEGSSAGRNNKSFDSGSYLIDLLDVQLAELNRPDGAYMGPDEGSL